MSFDTKLVSKIAKLARIEMSDSEKTEMAEKLSSIFKWIEQLQEVNTDHVPQMTSVAAMELPKRKDVVTDGHQRDLVLANAPMADHGCFLVPKVIE